MRLGDREIALAMLYMADRDRAALLAVLPQAKAERVWSEVELHKRLAIRYDQYVAAVGTVLAGLEARKQQPFRSYLRPKRDDRGR
jgi:hypothetical protein